MKFKLILLSFLLFSKTIFASIDSYISLYIPIANPQSELMGKDGIELKKVLFYTFYSSPESEIGGVTWSYVANTPHKRYKSMESNLAHIEGLKVDVDYGKKSCEVVIDSRNIVTEYSDQQLNKILDYVTKATKLNIKNAKVDCKIAYLKAPIKKIVLPMPKGFDLIEKSRESFKEFKLHQYPQYPFLSDTIYPLGYSKDGKFAYVLEHDTDPADIVDIEVFVQDLISDKILWQNRFRVDGSQKDANFTSFWKDRNKLIASKLDYYHIIPMENMKLDTTSIQYGNNGFEIYSNEKKSYAKDWGMKFLTHSTIIADSKGLGKKVINKESYKHPSHILARKPMATINFDNGKRRAVIVGRITRGWEGPPHNLHFEIVGVNLNVGFGK